MKHWRWRKGNLSPSLESNKPQLVSASNAVFPLPGVCATGLRSFLLGIDHQHVGFTCFHVAAGRDAETGHINTVSFDLLASQAQNWPGCQVKHKCTNAQHHESVDSVNNNQNHVCFTPQMDWALITLSSQDCVAAGTHTFWSGPVSELFHQQNFLRSISDNLRFYYAVWRNSPDGGAVIVEKLLTVEVDGGFAYHLPPFASNHVLSSPSADQQEFTQGGDCGALLYLKVSAQVKSTRNLILQSGRFQAHGQDIIPISVHRFGTCSSGNDKQMLSMPLDQCWFRWVGGAIPRTTDSTIIEFKGHENL
jgi:hypothetical protein